MAVGRGKRRGDPPNNTNSASVRLASGRKEKPTPKLGGPGGGKRHPSSSGAVESVKEAVEKREGLGAGGTHG